MRGVARIPMIKSLKGDGPESQPPGRHYYQLYNHWRIYILWDEKLPRYTWIFQICSKFLAFGRFFGVICGTDFYTLGIGRSRYGDDDKPSSGSRHNPAWNVMLGLNVAVTTSQGGSPTRSDVYTKHGEK